MYTILALLSCLIVVSQCMSLEKSCDPNNRWKYYNGSCYLFHKSNIATHSWFQATDECNQLGAHLLSIHSPEENDFINSVIGDIFAGYFNELWIGMSAIGNDAAFEWNDGTIVNFMNLQGDTEANLQREQKCVAINRLSKPIRWQLDHCNNDLSYICKREHGVQPSTITPTPTTVTPGNCPDGWTKNGNKCVKIFDNENERGNWSEAKEACQKKGPKGTLVTILNEKEQVQLTSLLLGVEVNLWIGVNKQPYSDYRWTDSSRFDYVNWAPREPTSQHFFNTCGVMQVSKIYPGKWKTSKCKEQLGYVCQIPPSTSVVTTTPMPPDCPTSKQGYRQFGNACFKMYGTTDQKEQRSWSDAEMACQDDGGHLASINNGLEQNFIFSMLPTEKDSTKSLWLGLNDASGDIFRWSDKWPVHFTNWGNGHPKHSDKARCAFVDTSSIEWNTTECSETRGYICKVTTENPPVIPENPDLVCPSHLKHWTDLGTDKCYYIENALQGDKRKSWGEAVSYCIQNDASLVSFHSQNDVDLLIPFIQKSGVPIWTGLIKKHHGGFEWEDQSPMNFEIWDDGEPAIFNNPQCGALTLTLKWSAEQCNTRYGYVCSAPKIRRTR